MLVRVWQHEQGWTSPEVLLATSVIPGARSDLLDKLILYCRWS